MAARSIKHTACANNFRGGKRNDRINGRPSSPCACTREDEIFRRNPTIDDAWFRHVGEQSDISKNLCLEVLVVHISKSVCYYGRRIVYLLNRVHSKYFGIPHEKSSEIKNVSCMKKHICMVRLHQQKLVTA